MINEEFNRLLKRQIKIHFGDADAIPHNLLKFIEDVNATYKNYDSNLDHLEHVLNMSSDELIKVNDELKILNTKNEQIIEQKTAKLKRASYNLQNAEKIAGLGNFSWNISTKKIELSQQMLEMCQMDSLDADFTISTFIDFFENSAEINAAIQNSIKEQTKFTLNNVRIKNNERYFVMEGELLKENLTDDEHLFLGVLQDITIVKLKEIELQDTVDALENYKKAIDYSAIVSKSDQKGIITYVNDKFAEISGYSADELVGAKHNIVNSHYHNKDFFNRMWKTINNGEVWKDIVRNQKKDGTYYWVDSTIVPFIKNGVIQEFISIRFDITDKMFIHQKVEDQKNFYESILNNIPVDIAVFNKAHQYLFVNPIAVQNNEIRQFLVGKDDFDYCKQFNKDISIAENRRSFFLDVLNKNTKIEFVDKSIASEGKISYRLRRFSPIYKQNNEFLFMIGFGIDITEKMEQEIQLQQSLEEKQSLLGEIHHRVKNNLALVSGLVELQGAKMTDLVMKSHLIEIQNRISAMSLIHEKLYKSSNFSKIDLKDYLHDLIVSLSSFFNKGGNIKVNFDLEQIFVSNKKAIPIALIVNELITNAFKYAFKDLLKGSINVKLICIENQVELSISDSGAGIDKDFNISKSSSLGFKLITIFTKQLKGTLKYFNNPGLTVTITFKNEEESTDS
jgi:PAS domain S-box-containing protein